jgi:phage portal protein BeeE
MAMKPRNPFRIWRRRSGSPLSFQDWVNYFSFNGISYPLVGRTTLGSPAEEIAGTFEGYTQGAYTANGVIFACMLARLSLFAEARFQYRRMSNGRPGDLFGDQNLQPLEQPWQNGTTGDLLTRMLQDADLGGNFYATRRPDNRIKRMRPDWVTIVLGSKSDPKVTGDLDAEVIGYSYKPGGPTSGNDPIVLLPEQVCHFAPIPDPLATYRGMSWLTPIIREVMADQCATTHKLKFFEDGATPNLAVALDKDISFEDFEKFIDKFESEHEGLLNAYKTLYLGGGAVPTVIGADMKQIDFKVTQGAGETRIAAAAGVPPVIVGLSEGLQAATYSNYSQARRRFADGTMRPLWRNAAGSLASLIKVPAGAELWYDDRDIPFLREDEKDAAEIKQTDAISIRTLVDAGFKPDTVIAAISSGDYSKLQHTGLYSVQLQPPGTTTQVDPSARAIAEYVLTRAIRGERLSLPDVEAYINGTCDELPAQLQPPQPAI